MPGRIFVCLILIVGAVGTLVDGGIAYIRLLYLGGLFDRSLAGSVGTFLVSTPYPTSCSCFAAKAPPFWCGTGIRDGVAADADCQYRGHQCREREEAGLSLIPTTPLVDRGSHRFAGCPLASARGTDGLVAPPTPAELRESNL